VTKRLAGALVVQTLLVAGIGVTALDVRAHYRVQDLGGVNIWGYRGDVMHQKGSNEIRIALVGGDMAFGWGVAAAETLAAYVRQRLALELERRGGRGRRVTQVNLAARGLQPTEYSRWIEHFAYLRPDVICILPDPVSHAPSRDRFLPDRRSWLFAAFGYSPILPLVLQEKGRIVGSVPIRVAGSLLERADVARAPAAAIPPDAYSPSLVSSVETAKQVATVGVVLVTAPEADGRAEPTVGSDPRVQIVRLAADARMTSDELRLDRFHFSAGGHSVAAESVAPAVLALVRAADGARR
jgi:hypothetical protein